MRREARRSRPSGRYDASPSCPPWSWSHKSVRLVEAEQAVHPLHRTAGGALHQVVDDRHHDDRPAVRRRRKVSVVARDHVFHPGRLGKHAHERPACVETANRLDCGRRVERLFEDRLHRRVNAARERPRVRHECEPAVLAGGRARERRDLGRVTVRERVVGVEIAVALRVMRARNRAAPGTGAARDRRDEDRRLGEIERKQRNGGEERRRAEAARMRDMRRRRAIEMLGYRAGEFARARGRTVRVLVDTLVLREIRVAEIRRDVDDRGFRARGGGASSAIRRSACATRRAARPRARRSADGGATVSTACSMET